LKLHLLLIARLFLVALFLYAGLPKLLTPQDFALVVFRFHLVPDAAINVIALLLPWLEIFGAIALLLPSWRAAGAALLSFMLLVATTAIIINLVRGLDIDCGCFTLKPGASPIGLWLIFRNLALLALTLWAGRSTPAAAQ
jgi:uncharacterized membrane protein YphA (DoxX/SURF4 family)